MYKIQMASKGHILKKNNEIRYFGNGDTKMKVKSVRNIWKYTIEYNQSLDQKCQKLSNSKILIKTTFKYQNSIKQEKQSKIEEKQKVMINIHSNTSEFI